MSNTLTLPSEKQILDWIEQGMVFTRKPIAYKNRETTGCPDETISDQFNFPRGSWEMILENSQKIREAYEILLNKYEQRLEKPVHVKPTNFIFETMTGEVLSFSKKDKQEEDELNQETLVFKNLSKSENLEETEDSIGFFNNQFQQ